MKVLIVDASASLRSLLSTLMIDQGHDVVAALPDGSTLIDVLSADPPELIFLDHDLPGRNGLDLLADIGDIWPGLDVVFMTSSTDAAVQQRAAQAGAAGFVRKPFAQSDLVEQIERIRARSATRNVPPEMPAEVRPVHADAGASPGGRDHAGNPQPAHRPPRKASTRSTMVIADDNGSIRAVLQGLMTAMGFEVVHMAKDGSEAVEAVRNHRPGVVCLDVEMPHMSGLEALAQIRACSPESVVVMVTANASRAFVQQAAEAGARGYIVKPLRPAYIETVMRRFLP